jgi:outer membrane protein assembly factor BamB
MIRHRVSVGCLACYVVISAMTAVADDWPGWRGPQRDGVWRETGIVEKFSVPQLEIRWSEEISSGYSGPTVADGRVFVSDRVVEDDQQWERVHCREAFTGRHLWTHTYDCPYVDVGYQAGPRGSVTISDGAAYSLGTMGHIHCLEATSGDVLWRKDLNTEYRIRMPEWGIACSPLVEEDLVIVQIGGSDGADIIAFDKRTGKERWRALDDPTSYSSPIVIEQAGQRVLVCWTGARVVGLNPQTGELFWEYPLAPQRFVRACASPVWKGNRLFVSGFFDGSLMLRLHDKELSVAKTWRRVGPDERTTDGLHTNIAEPLILGDHVYGIDSYGHLRCLSASDGSRVWESLEVVPKQRWSTARFIVNGKNIWIFTERGELIIARLSPDGYEEISRAKLIKPTKVQLPTRRGGVCWAHPAFAGRHVFARSDEELLCASLEAESPAE